MNGQVKKQEKQVEKEDAPEVETEQCRGMAYEYTNKRGTKYYLHKKDVTLRGSGKMQTIYFFAKNERSESIDDLPVGFEVAENKRSGLPALRRK